jgi:hypothetical protein
VCNLDREKQERLVRALIAPARVPTGPGSNAQREQFDQADSDHQHHEGYGIVVEPMPPLYLHDCLPFCPSLVGLAGRMVQMGRSARTVEALLLVRSLNAVGRLSFHDNDQGPAGRWCHWDDPEGDFVVSATAGEA